MLKIFGWIEEKHNEESNSYITDSDNSHENDDINNSTKRKRKNSKVESMKDEKKEYLRVDKRDKVKVDDDQRVWDFQRFLYNQFYNYGWKEGSRLNLSLQCPVPGCKLLGLAKIWNEYTD